MRADGHLLFSRVQRSEFPLNTLHKTLSMKLRPTASALPSPYLQAGASFPGPP